MASKRRKQERARQSEIEKNARSVDSYIQFKNQSQKEAWETISNNTISFLIGPAGTGKTFLAVAYAVKQFLAHKYEKIIVTRPAVEAGEKLGFLPGELEDKINPYMLPLLDYLEEFLDPRFVRMRFAEGLFEIAPLAYMRGRTLKNSIVIFDEAQNATKDQTLMLLTRLGEGSKIIVTGDPDQSDLNGRGRLRQIANILSEKCEGCDHSVLEDSVRHPLIEKIICAFDMLE